MAGKEIRSSFLEREIRMVLVGKTGVGKSATGNTICGAGKGEQIFRAFARAIAVTRTCKQHSFKRFGTDLQLVDVPGFCDTNRSREDIQQEVMKCVGMSSPGIHAILFVVRIGRFTEEDKTTLERFLRCFGQEAKSFVIVIFTGKDYLEEEGGTIDNYIGDCPVALKQFLLDTSFRFIAVNNNGSTEEKEKFTKDLMDKVRKMVDENGGQCYTDEMYQRCEADLREAEKNEKLDEKRQEELEKKLYQENAAFEEQLKIQRLKIQEMEKRFEKELKERERDQEDQLRERLKAIELRMKNEEENKHLEEEKKHLEEEKNRQAEQREAADKRQTEQREAADNIQRELERMKEFQRKQMEEFERRKEDLRFEEIRKQTRMDMDEDKVGVIRTIYRSLKDFVVSLW